MDTKEGPTFTEDTIGADAGSILYSTHVLNRSSIPVRLHAVYKTTLGTANDIEGTREDSQEYLDPGQECTFEEKFSETPHNVRMQICKLYADDGINKKWSVERQSPFGELPKTHAEFEVIDDEITGGIELRKIY